MKLDRYFRFASRTTMNGLDSKVSSYVVARHYLEDRFSPALVASCTYLMHGFGTLSFCFQRISKGPFPKFLQLIAFFLILPSFKASHFFFKLAYTIQQRRLSRAGRYCALHGGKDFSVQFPERIPEFNEVAGLYQFLQSLARRVQGGP
jgi:hypothetical protein